MQNSISKNRSKRRGIMVNVSDFFNKCICKVKRALGLHTTARFGLKQKEIDQEES